MNNEESGWTLCPSWASSVLLNLTLFEKLETGSEGVSCLKFQNRQNLSVGHELESDAKTLPLEQLEKIQHPPIARKSCSTEYGTRSL
jgi:hypothetical protein